MIKTPQIGNKHLVKGNLYIIVPAYSCDGCAFCSKLDGMCRIPDEIVRKYDVHKCYDIKYECIGNINIDGMGILIAK